jgi:hypothetical protein
MWVARCADLLDRSTMRSYLAPILRSGCRVSTVEAPFNSFDSTRREGTLSFCKPRRTAQDRGGMW